MDFKIATEAQRKEKKLPMLEFSVTIMKRTSPMLECMTPTLRFALAMVGMVTI